MEKPFITTKRRNKKLWFVSLFSLLIWFVMLSTYCYMSKMDTTLADLLGSGFDNVTDVIQAHTVFDKLSEGLDGNSRELSNESVVDLVHKDRNGSGYHQQFADSAMVDVNSNSTDGGDVKSQYDFDDNVVNVVHRIIDKTDTEGNTSDVENVNDLKDLEGNVVDVVDSVVTKTDTEGNTNDVENVQSLKDLNRNDASVGNDADPACRGRYVYVHEIPSEFNDDLLRECGSLSRWTDMCSFSSNMGLGPPLGKTGKVFSDNGWFDTDQFLLEVIFHNRMKQYKCLTKDSSMASAIFVPYYAGLDISRYLWGFNSLVRDSGSLRLVKWLRERPEWKRMWGRDHFMVAGRITWDFRRSDDGESDDWGNRLLLLPESANMSILVIEKSPWNNNDFAIPYPTYFHPANDKDLKKWQQRMRRQRRKFLFSFAGAPRPGRIDSIRNEIIDQCKASRRKCRMLECDLRGEKCHQPVYVMAMFQSSTFCLQPPGDSYTRRSAFDSILAGCIPVFFHPGSAYIQYLWHLPKDHTRYSVFISGMDVKHGTVSIEEVLSRIPKAKVVAMREEVIRLISRVTYADPRSKLKLHEDAFDLTMKGILDRVGKLRLDMKEGVNLSLIPESETWKYSLFGTLDEHEWDPFFYKRVL